MLVLQLSLILCLRPLLNNIDEKIMIKYIVAIAFLTAFPFAFLIAEHQSNKRPIKPKGSVSYSLLILINEKSEVLLLRRKGTSYGNGLYSLPGGKIEAGETAAEAVIREAREEIGVKVVQPQLVHVIDRQGTQTEFYIFVFKPTIVQGKPVNGEFDKCDDVSWFPIHKLPSNILPAHKQAIELILKNVLYSQHGWE